MSTRAKLYTCLLAGIASGAAICLAAPDLSWYGGALIGLIGTSLCEWLAGDQ